MGLKPGAGDQGTGLGQLMWPLGLSGLDLDPLSLPPSLHSSARSDPSHHLGLESPYYCLLS